MLLQTQYRASLPKPGGGVTKKTNLWRYMTFEKFCWLIETSKLYHARLDQLGDPFEGSATKAYVEARKAMATDPKAHPGQALFNEIDPYVNRMNLYRTFATCWHASDHESDAQWKIYASGCAGIAVVSSMERLQNAVDFTPHTEGILAEVDYVDFDTDEMRNRFGSYLNVGFAKRKAFAHEKEVRGVIRCEMQFTQGSKIDEALVKDQKAAYATGISAKVNLPALIEAIVISPIAKTYIEELVQVVTRRHNLDHLVKKSTLGGKPIY